METSLFIGRFQPFHEGHAAIVERLLSEGKSVCVAVRDTVISENNPLAAIDRYREISRRYCDNARVTVIIIPDIEEVVYGRDVGYKIREIRMPPAIEKISGTALRAAL